MAARLRLESSGEERLGADLPVRGTLVIGSSPERAGFIVSGQGIEDAHCAIGRVKGGGWAIKDLGSRYGTLVNGKKVTSCRLEAGDVVLLGALRLTVVDPEAPPAPAPAAPLSEEPPAERGARRGDPDLPERIGGYRIERLLGRGGMGAVYLAVQENLNRPVALKVLSPARAADAAFVQRFQAEARAAAALHHPNVVVVHDVGAADGHHFLSMEYMAGGSLEERVSRHGPIPWREALDILACAARGLSYAEEKGIVHRDIKPANLMVDGTGTTKIADLGLATSADEDDSLDRKVHGTPHFISPEQARGEAVDGRSDLYSLGATAYRLITGRTPFTGESTREILRAHFTQEPARIEEVPDAVDALVRRLLRKEPAERFATAGDLLAELERLRTATGAPAEDEAQSSAGRRAVLALVVVVVLAVAGLLGRQLLGGPSSPELTDPVLEGEPTPEVEPGPAPGTGADEGFFEGAPTTPAVDEEQELKVLELEAELAYNKLADDLERPARITALDELAAEYPTTSYGSRARAEALELRGEERRAEAEARRVERLFTEARESLRSAVGLTEDAAAAPAPGPALRALLAWTPPPGLEAGPELTAVLAAVAQELEAGALSAARARLAELDTSLAAGEFADAEARLTALEARLDLPALPEELVPAEHAELLSLGREVASRRGSLAASAAAWERARQRADAERLAAVLGPAGDFAELLDQRDLGGLIARLRGLLDSLATDAARRLPARLLAELEPAAAARAALVDGFAAGEWKRTKFLDASGRRTSRGDAVGVTAEGLLVQQGEEPELRRWKVFGPRELANLFQDRLSREYTAEERRGVAALLVLAALDEAHDAIARELSPSRRSVFQPADAQALLAAFEPAAAWLAQEPSLPAEAREFLDRERDAAAVLGQALIANEEERWSQAVASLEALFRDHGDSLLVALFSDGAEWGAERGAAGPTGTAPEPPPTIDAKSGPPGDDE